MFKSGFVAVVGKPNAGKSSLVNKLVGFDVAIATPKPQTTRFNIKGIVTSERSQIVFIDTPGVHTPKHKLGEYMARGVMIAIESVDLVVYLVDASKPVLDSANKQIIETIVKAKKKILLCINKVDSVKKENILKIIDEYQKYVTSVGGKFMDIVPVSVKKSDGLEILVNCIEENLPEGTMIYDEDDVTDISKRDIVCELIRGKALRYLNEEVPHGINVITDKMEEIAGEGDSYSFNIEATIICKKKSHKPIVIGKDGIMLKRITDSAKRDISRVLEVPVKLKIWVKVREDWDDNDTYLTNIKDKIR